MKNNGLFSTLFIEDVRKQIALDDLAQGRMATLAQIWRTRDEKTVETLWNSFMKHALGSLQFAPANGPEAPGVYLLYEDWGFSNCIAVVYLIEAGADIDDTSVGRFWPAKLVWELKKRNLNWGILTDGATWRLYSTKSSRPYEDFVELPLVEALENDNQSEYGLFERFFHKDSFVPEEAEERADEAKKDEAAGVYKCRLDRDKEVSEKILDEQVKKPLLLQVDEILQYICNGFIADTPRKGDEYTEEQRKEIFESSVKLLYRCLFFFYAEARRLLPSEADKAETYEKHSIRALCQEAHKFQWGKRKDTDDYGLWQHLKGLTNAVNEGDPEYGIMGYNGGLFDDEEEVFLGEHKLRNDFLARALYLLAYVEPYDGDPDKAYEIPYEDLEVRHLGELYENILEYTVLLADADRIRHRTKKGVEILLASETTKQKSDTVIKKGDVYFAESALERKQTGSYYTAESLVRFLNGKAVIELLREKFEKGYRRRFDEFLEQARSGYDNATKRGAGRSAVALVERFANEVILDFKVCDSAMGSGHFLVDASNQMSGLVLELLAEIPDIQGLNTNVTSDPNHWRRLITRHCLFGVDLNPLAVDLAKLSLWLNCFGTNHKLTFIDHHLRRGNSLIGIRTLDQLRTIPQTKKDSNKKEKQQLTFNFDDIATAFAEAARTVKSITEIPEDDTDRQKAMYDDASDKTKTKLAPLADLFTAYLMDSTITEEEYRDLFLRLARGEDISNISNARLREIWSRVEAYATRHDFFHWAFAFPDTFDEDGKGGFDATVGNPPWDILKPNSQEFFSAYDPDFRQYKKQEAVEVSKRLLDNNSAIRQRWDDYCESFLEQSKYVREPSAYQELGKGDINTYKLFLERFFAVLRKDGRIGIVVPSGFYTDQGCLMLRKQFFEKSQIRCLCCFENRRAIFNIHRSFKFVLFSTQKGGKTDSFKCAFMEHDPERLPAIHENALIMKAKDVQRFSPEALCLMEFKSQKALNIASKIYMSSLLIGPDMGLTVAREIDLTGHSPILSTKEIEGPKLFEGKMIWQFDCDFLNAHYWFYPEAYQEFYRKDSINRTIELEGYTRKELLKKVRNGTVELAPERYRLAFREVAADTNERTFISTILPLPSPHSYTIRTFEHYRPKLQGKDILYTDDYPLETMCFWCGVSNSFSFDFLARIKTFTHLSTTYMDLPLTNKNEDKFRAKVAALVSRLICVDERFTNLWTEVYREEWKDPLFWYSNDDLKESSYGPEQEKEIRQKLKDSASVLTKDWAPHCGVYDRTPDRRDTGDRAQLRAEIDAYVAHLYGLSREDFEYILDTFPVLKRKEDQAFGEYMSKRKCLEEYGRISLIL